MKLIGKFGEIKVNGDVCTALIVNKLLEKEFGSFVTFSTEDLPKWIKRLKIESTEDGNIKFADWP